MINQMKRILLLCYLLVYTSPSFAQEVELVWGFKIPLRDGVRLSGTVYKPAKQKEALPVIFTLTPYTADTYHQRAFYFAKNGYVFVLVDVRGRGNSEGTFEPFANEGQDGHDVVEFLAKESFCNGKVTMWGGSYAGYDQWATLKEFPPHLATIVPAASAAAGVDFPFFKNIFYTYDIQWLTFTSSKTANANLFGESDFWIQRFRDWYLNHRPYKDLDQSAGNTSTFFQTWIEHPTPDSYWQAMNPTNDQYAKMNVPILSITGSYDGDQAGALYHYKMHMKNASVESQKKHYLIIGPWDHAGTRTPRKEVGGLTFGEASMVDLNKLHKEWYDWAMKSGKLPEFLKDQIAYYVTGAEEWKYAKSFDQISNSKKTLYLQSDGQANEVWNSGTLSAEKPGNQKPDRYVYDPLDLRPAELETSEVSEYLTDQRYALNLHRNGLVYHSEPFAEPVEVSGHLKLIAWISMDVPDTDFQVSAYEIAREGKSILLSEDLLRARYRDSLLHEKLVKPGEVNRYQFDSFPFISRKIAKGSRIRLLIRCPNTIYLQKNYNSGRIVAQESAKDARTAHIQLFHDSDHPSSLELPIVK
ncbi:CocE/NonD family hydrolase [bacterium]|nr:CocE/NonD family hydrolase [bacterium]